MSEHIPVLLTEFMENVLAMDKKPNLAFDGTFGRGGHTKVLMDTFSQLKIVGWDQDPQAIEFGKVNFTDYIKAGRLVLSCRNFSDIEDKFFKGGLDLVLLDLGVSSPQLDQPERGFSFYKDGPLDMRMNPENSLTAEDIVNTWKEEELNCLFKEYGEIYSPYRVTRAVVHERKKEPIKTTLQLAKLIEKQQGWRKKGHHPATSFFQALRLQVNQELECLVKALPQIVEKLNKGGRFFCNHFSFS